MGRVTRLGDLLRNWRTQKDVSQMALAFESGISTRHLSFIECGKSIPSRAVIQKIGVALDLNKVERNQLLASAGFAPEEGARTSDATLDFAELEALLGAIHPVPALALDSGWNIVRANPAIARMFQLLGFGEEDAPTNFLSLCFRSAKMDVRLANAAELRKQLTTRVRAQFGSDNFDDLVAMMSDKTMNENRKYNRDNDVHIKMLTPFSIRANDDADEVRFMLTFCDFTSATKDGGKFSVLSFFPGNDRSRTMCRHWGDGSFTPEPREICEAAE